MDIGQDLTAVEKQLNSPLTEDQKNVYQKALKFDKAHVKGAIREIVCLV